MRLFLSIFFLLGFFLFASSVYAIFQTWQAESWKPASGTMLKLDCRVMGTGSRSSASRHVHYQYTVDGKQYESEREYFGGQVSNNESCLGNYREGGAITAYYNPDQPSEAVLRRGAYREPGSGVLISLAFMGFAMLMYWLARRDERRKAATKAAAA